MKTEFVTLRNMTGRAVLTLLVLLASATTTLGAKKTRSWALWVPADKTVYFVRSKVDYSANGATYNGNSVKARVIEDYHDASKEQESTPQLKFNNTVKGNCTTVHFTKSFSDARPVDCSSWFKGFVNLQTIKGIGNLNTTKVTTMKSMFQGCQKMSSLYLSGFSTTKVENMTYMFNGCKGLTAIYVNDSKWKTKQVEESRGMFNGCGKLIGQDGTKYNKNKPRDKSVAHTGSGGLLRRAKAAGKVKVVADYNTAQGTVTPYSPTLNVGDKTVVTVSAAPGYRVASVSAKYGSHDVAFTASRPDGSPLIIKGDGQIVCSDVVTATLSLTVSGYANARGARRSSDDGGDDLKVTVGYEMLGDPQPSYGITCQNVSCSVDGQTVTEAPQDAVVQVVATDGVEPPAGHRWAVASDDPEDEDYNKPVFSSPEVDIDADGTFIMPPAPVTVERVSEPVYYELTGTYLNFYDDAINQITEAYEGQRVTVSVDPLRFVGGHYHTGDYTSPDGITITPHENYEADGVFTMPAKPVSVTAVLEEQVSKVLDLTGSAPFAIDEETANYMTGLHGYVTWHNNEYYTIDANLDGQPDFKVTGAFTEGPYTVEKLAGAASLGANYAMALRTPGPPLSWKDVVFNIGQKASASNIFLFETAELPNGHTLATYDGQTVNVTLADRVLWKDGYWNTICLPFDVDIANSPLVGATVKTLEDAELDGNGKLTLIFTQGSLTQMEAGKPYLIKWAKPNDYVPFNGNDNFNECSDLLYPVFQNVILKDELNPTTIGDLVIFGGIYKLQEFTQTDAGLLFVGGKNNLFYPEPELQDPKAPYDETDNPIVSMPTLAPFRSYFQLLNGLEVGGTQDYAVRSFNLDFGEDETTGIVSLTPDPSPTGEGSGYWYTIDGRRLSSKPTKAGLYIHGGRVVGVK